MTTKTKAPSTKPSYEELRDKALEMGAKSARIISIDTVVTAPWVRMRCQYGCAGYGRRLSCPPYSPTPEQTQAVLSCYSVGILMEGDMWKVNPVLVEVEREVFLSGYYKAWSLGEGPCHQCEACALRAGCRFPQKLRPSMEASGIDVFQTVRNNGIELDVVKDYDCAAHYFGLVLVE